MDVALVGLRALQPWLKVPGLAPFVVVELTGAFPMQKAEYVDREPHPLRRKSRAFSKPTPVNPNFNGELLTIRGMVCGLSLLRPSESFFPSEPSRHHVWVSGELQGRTPSGGIVCTPVCGKSMLTRYISWAGKDVCVCGVVGANSLVQLSVDKHWFTFRCPWSLSCGCILMCASWTRLR